MKYVAAVVGINEATYNDGAYLPHTQGFDYVGTTMPFTLAWDCDDEQVSLNKYFDVISRDIHDF